MNEEHTDVMPRQNARLHVIKVDEGLVISTAHKLSRSVRDEFDTSTYLHTTQQKHPGN